MDMIRRYLTQIKAQLAGLTISQKLLIGLLAVVMLATVFFTVMFSAKPAMVPLIPQPMTAEEINAAEMVMKGKYEYQVSGDKILVPAELQYAIRGDLGAAQALPKKLDTAFSRVIINQNPFSTEAMNSRAWNNALQEELSHWLNNFPGVKNANVIVAYGQRMGLGTPAVPSSASVNLQMKDGAPLSSRQLMAVVDMVVGAVPGMKREDVHVSDGERSYRVPSSDTPMPADLLEYKKTLEADFSQKLLTMFEHMGDVKIAVNVVPDLSVRVRQVESFDPKSTVVKAESETSHDTSSTEGNSSEGEPGVPSNVGMKVVDSSGNGHKTSSSSSDTSTKNVVKIGSTRETITLPAGVELKELTASLSLPRTYLVHVYQRMQHDPKADPDDEKLQPVIASELKRAQQQAKNAIGAKSDEQVQVDWFDDTMMARDMPGAAPKGGTGGIPILLAQYAKQGVLAIVALGALGMMLMMVRKAVPAGEGGESGGGFLFGGSGGKSKRKSEVGQLDAGEDVFGEANQGEAVLTGIELDDDTLQSRKMVDEVSTMIKENPENAAALVKRWMTKSK